MKQQSRCRSRSSFGATIFLVSLALLLNAMETNETPQNLGNQIAEPHSSRKDGTAGASSSSRDNSLVRSVSLEEINKPHSSTKDGTARASSLSRASSFSKDNSLVRNIPLKKMNTTASTKPRRSGESSPSKDINNVGHVKQTVAKFERLSRPLPSTKDDTARASSLSRASSPSRDNSLRRSVSLEEINKTAGVKVPSSTSFKQPRDNNNPREVRTTADDSASGASSKNHVTEPLLTTKFDEQHREVEDSLPSMNSGSWIIEPEPPEKESETTWFVPTKTTDSALQSLDRSLDHSTANPANPDKDWVIISDEDVGTG